jgi:hypothetical protein
VSDIKSLPKGATLKEAVDSYRRRDPVSLEKRTVRQVADEMLAAKRAANLSDAFLWDLKIRVNRFCTTFQMNIGGVSRLMLQAWLDDMKGSGRAKQKLPACGDCAVSIRPRAQIPAQGRH